MKVNTTARHCELDPEVRLFAQQRMEKLLRYFREPDEIMEAHVVIAAEKYRHSAEITLKLRRGEVVGREEADEPRAAIELAAERIEAQVRRLKEKRLDRKRDGRVRGEPAPAGTAEAGPGEELGETLEDWTRPSDNGGAAGRAPLED